MVIPRSASSLESPPRTASAAVSGRYCIGVSGWSVQSAKQKSASGQHCGVEMSWFASSALPRSPKIGPRTIAGLSSASSSAMRGAVGAVYQHVVKTELVREALRGENIVGAVAVEVAP